MITLGQRETDNIKQMITIRGSLIQINYHIVWILGPNKIVELDHIS